MTNSVQPIGDEVPIPSAQQLGITGSIAHIYEVQVALIRRLEKPEYFVDISKLVLDNLEMALAESDPSTHPRIRVHCQQLIVHYAFLGRAFLDLMRTKNRDRFRADVLPFVARLTNDMAKSVSDLGKDKTNGKGIGAAAVTAIAGIDPVTTAVASAGAAVAAAISKRLDKEGEIWFTALFSWWSSGKQHEEERERWILSVETLLDALSRRVESIGKSHSLADIGRQYRDEIVELHFMLWEQKRFKWRKIVVFAGIGGVIFVWAGCLPMLVVLGIVFYMIHRQGMDPVIHFGALALCTVVGVVVLVAIVTSIRQFVVRATARRRIDRFIRILDSGNPDLH